MKYTLKLTDKAYTILNVMENVKKILYLILGNMQPLTGIAHSA